MWYKRSEQTNRNAAWYSMLGIVNILGSLLSYGLGHIKSDLLHSYQIIFLFCGLLTVCTSIAVFIFMVRHTKNPPFDYANQKISPTAQ